MLEIMERKNDENNVSVTAIQCNITIGQNNFLVKTNLFSEGCKNIRVKYVFNSAGMFKRFAVGGETGG
jgi:hypothetical protein